MGTKTRISVTASCYLYGAVLFLLLPAQWVAALAVSVAIHELGHIAALGLLKIPIYGIHMTPWGVQLHTPAMSRRGELICAAAGPACGLSLLLLGHSFPLLALFSLFHSAFNLLPVFPADGGRICRILCGRIFRPKTARVVERTVTMAIALLIAAMGVYAAVVLKLGLLPGVLGASVAAKAMKNHK